jgi:hypothetical protein
MDNKAIADQLLRGKKKSFHVGTLKAATAIRVAGHRLGGVLTVKKQKKGFRLIKSTAKVVHRPASKKKAAVAPIATRPATLVHTSIRRSASDVYAFVANPKNLAQWAAGLSRAQLKPQGGHWLAKSPMGNVKIKFTPSNKLGVVDHEETLPDGQIVRNPLRVQPNGEGAEVIFTLYQLPGVSLKAFKADATKIGTDLKKLKSLLESPAKSR